jgi:peroxiredoxin
MKILRHLALAILSAGSLTATAAIAPTPDAVSPLGIGATVPSASIVTPSGKTLSLSEALGGKPTLLVFYRGGWCPYCTVHLGELAGIESQLVDLGWQIVGISPDTPAALAESAGKHQLGYRLFSDRAMEATAAFGLAFKVDDKTVERYKGHKIDLAPVPGDPESRWLPVPAAYLIDASGTVRFAYTNADYKTRIDPDELIAAARAAGK